MKQKKKKHEPKRFGRNIFLLTVSIFVLLVMSSVMIDVIYYASSAPIVMPEYSAQELWNSPLPTPEWISEIPTTYDDGVYWLDKPLCISLNLVPVWDWEIGDDDQILRQTTGIAIDSMTVSRRDIDFWHVSMGGQLNCEKCTIDEPNYICFDSPSIETGLHTATIRIESNTGIGYSYEWAFQVADAN